MTLKFSTSGRPMIECINPECRKLHSIYRRGDYVQKAQTKVCCRSCGTKWQLNEQDKAALQQHYEQRQRELEDKKQKKEQKNTQNVTKNEPIGKHAPINQTKKPESKKPAAQSNQKKSWLDQILS